MGLHRPAHWIELSDNVTAGRRPDTRRIIVGRGSDELSIRGKRYLAQGLGMSDEAANLRAGGDIVNDGHAIHRRRRQLFAVRREVEADDEILVSPENAFNMSRFEGDEVNAHSI